MDIIFNGTYKSLTAFEWKEVPLLAILTGTNGSGKTQLLELIYDTVIDNVSQRSWRVGIIGESYQKGEITFLKSEWVLNNTSSMNLVSIQNELTGLKSQFDRQQQTQHQPKLDFLMEQTAKKIGKTRHMQISNEEFIENFPIDYLTNDTELTNQISRIFVDYNVSRIELLANQLTDDEVVQSIGPKPWVVINEIMKEANLSFVFNDPELTGLKATFKLEITDSLKNVKIEFADLSSGEKVLVSLVFFLYTSREKKFFPKFLLLDEPDAHLHPSMTKQFLDVILNVFVNQHKIRVLMTTHSPSTIALAPEENIFTVNKTGPKILKVNKDAALKILTSGVPSFSVNYENRRQVFVESPFDVLFYEKIYQKLSPSLIPEVSLSFISSGDSRTDKNGIPVSNCGQVVHITSALRDAGNKFIWGIIDRDDSNPENDYIKVLGNGNRYSIESYLFDPILLAALLLREKIISKDELGLASTDSYINLRYFDQEKLQKAASLIVDRVSLNKKLSIDGNPVKCVLMNGIEIELPYWYLNYPGHQLEEIILMTFPQLNGLKKGKEEALKLEIIDKIIDDLPVLLSEDFEVVFRKVQAI